MDADSIVNRDDPIPVLTISSHDPTSGGGDFSHALGNIREGSKKPSAKLKDSISRAIDPTKAGPSMQDRLFSTSVALQCPNPLLPTNAPMFQSFSASSRFSG